jgi:hypothetical protein
MPKIKIWSNFEYFLTIFFLSNWISIKPKGASKYRKRIQKKHLTRKKKKKVMETRNMETIIGLHPMEKGVKEEGL